MNIALRICALVFNIYVLSISGSSYIGLPERSWTDASTACILQSKEKIESSEMTNYTSTYIKGVSNVWIGSWVKYSYWAAFIGCGSGFTTEPPANSSSTKATLRECLLHCSDNPSFSHIAVQSSKCRCLPGIESANKGTDCRRKCDTEYESLCDSGHSAMLFTFVKDFRVNPSEMFFGDECAYVNPANMTYNAASCEEKLLYSCKNGSNSLKTAHWDGYQEKCREEGEHFLYDGWYTGQNPKLEPHWTPIFRVHKTYNVGHPSGKSACLSWLLDQENSKDSNSTKFVREEDCSKHQPFICVKSRNRDYEHCGKSLFSREVTVYIVIAAGIVILLLILVIIKLCSKLSQRLYVPPIHCSELSSKTCHSPFLSTESSGQFADFSTVYRKETQEINQVIDLELADGFPESLQLADESIRVRETYIEAGDAPVKSGISNYNQVYDDVTKGFFIK